jgi:hypothetical protein
MSIDSNTSVPLDASYLDAADIERTVEIIARSEEFKRSSRLTDILRFLISETMAGRGDRLKAYVIATEVLGRNVDFDAALDSIVRVEIARLRTALKLFYSHDVTTPLIIDIPKGGYRPVIIAAQVLQKGPEQQPLDMPHRGFRRHGSKSAGISTRIWLSAVAAAGMLITAGLVLFLQYGPIRQSATLPPLVLISPVVISTSDPGVKTFELGLNGELLAELSRYQWMSVAYRSEAFAVTIPRERRSFYTVNMNLVIEGDHYSSVTVLSDAASGRVRSTYLDHGVLPERQVFPSLAASARRIAADIGRSLGAVTQAELEGGPYATTGPYSCLLSLRRYHLSWLLADREVFRACALAEPRQTDALSLGLAAYANLEEARFRGGDSRTALIAAAVRDVGTAIAMRPKLYLLSAIAARAAACQGDLAQVEAILGDIRRNNPNDPNALAGVANVRAVVLGDLASGMILARKARELSLIPQNDDSTVPALDSLMRGDWAEAVALVSEPPRGTNPLELAVLLAANGELGDRAGAQSAAAGLTRAGFADAGSIRGYVANECLAEAIRKRIVDGVNKALGLL